jgi:putative phosphoesterase
MSKKFFRKVVLGVFIIFLPLFLGTFLIYKQNKMPKISQFQNQELKIEKKEILVGIISDTHIPSRANDLPKEIFEVFKNTDLVIHSGDIENLETLKKLEKIKKVIAIEGNSDQKETKEKLPEGISLKIYNWKIGIIHSPFPFWLGSHFNFVQEMAAKRLAEKENFDILIFGHTHRPLLKEINLKGKKILLINPGSAAIPFFTQPSVAILKISQKDFEAKIINLK